MKKEIKLKIIDVLTKNAAALLKNKHDLDFEIKRLDSALRFEKKMTPIVNQTLSMAQKDHRSRANSGSIQKLRLEREKAKQAQYWVICDVVNAYSFLQEVKTEMKLS